jgi:hypothetical protein
MKRYTTMISTKVVSNQSVRSVSDNMYYWR